MDTRDQNRNAADFVVRLVGPGVKPEEVTFRNLSRVLNAVQRLVEQSEEPEEQPIARAEGEKPREPLSEIRALRLLDVKTSSAAYWVRAREPESALRLIADTAQDIAAPDLAEWSSPTLSALKDLSEVARSVGCEVEFRHPNNGRRIGDIIATIGPNTYNSIVSSAFISGATTVYARLERVGGAVEMHCGIRIATQTRMVICRVENAELVRKLGAHMYKWILLTGRATWVKRSQMLKHLVVTGYEAPKTGSIMDALDEIRQAGGNAWDNIEDPDAYIAEMRGQ